MLSWKPRLLSRKKRTKDWYLFHTWDSTTSAVRAPPVLAKCPSATLAATIVSGSCFDSKIFCRKEENLAILVALSPSWTEMSSSMARTAPRFSAASELSTRALILSYKLSMKRVKASPVRSRASSSTCFARFKAEPSWNTHTPKQPATTATASSEHQIFLCWTLLYWHPQSQQTVHSKRCTKRHMCSKKQEKQERKLHYSGRGRSCAEIDQQTAQCIRRFLQRHHPCCHSLCLLPPPHFEHFNRVKEGEEVGDLIRASSLVLRILQEFLSGTAIWIVATQGMDMPKFLREMCLCLQGEEELGQILPRMLCDVFQTDEELPHSWSDVLRWELMQHHRIRVWGFDRTGVLLLLAGCSFFPFHKNRKSAALLLFVVVSVGI